MLFDERRIVQKTYFWNLAANVLYALQSALLLLIVSRFGTLEETGLFSIIYTTTHMLSTLGNYSMRNFQVSDVKNEYCFENYWTSRIISCGLMAVAGLAYGVFRYGISNSLLIVLLFVGYRTTDNIEDVIHGHVQKEGRLDAASCVKTVRVFLASIAFSAVYIITKDLTYATLTMLIVSVVILVVSIPPFNRQFPGLRYRLLFVKTGKLLWTCLPLCAGALIQIYVINSPKYAIDRLMSSESQAVFNILFMPVFSINLVVMFIFNPLVAGLSKMWAEGKTKEFWKIIAKQMAIILGFTVFAVICSWFFGCELLGFVYGVELIEYRLLMTILMLFGGIAALTTFMSIIITIMRRQRAIMVSYVIALIISFVFSDTMVGSYGMDGAGYMYGILMAMVLIFLIIAVVASFRRVKT